MTNIPPSNNNLNDYGTPIKEIDFLDNIFSFCFPIYPLLPLHPSLHLYLLPEYLLTSIGISFPLSVALPSPSSSTKLSPTMMRSILRFSSLSLYYSQTCSLFIMSSFIHFILKFRDLCKDYHSQLVVHS